MPRHVPQSSNQRFHSDMTLVSIIIKEFQKIFLNGLGSCYPNPLRNYSSTVVHHPFARSTKFPLVKMTSRGRPNFLDIYAFLCREHLVNRTLNPVHTKYSGLPTLAHLSLFYFTSLTCVGYIEASVLEAAFIAQGRDGQIYGSSIDGPHPHPHWSFTA